MSDLVFESIAEISRRIEAKDVSPVELVEACLERIEQRSDDAFVRTTPDAAREHARIAEKEIAAGDYRGPLHGIPIGHKDCWDTAGVATESAAKIYEGRVPAEDGTLVSKLAEAGGITLGKLTMPELAHGDAGLDNPWGPNASPGGSSAGSGVAVSTGQCFAASGSDAGGSIRVPAALCGVVGFKPTYGRVSRHGGIPHTYTLDHAGPLTRTVEDCAIVLEAMSGYDPLDPSSADEPVPDMRSAARDPGISGMRVGVIPDYSFAGCEAGVRVAGENAVRRLAALGADIVEIEVAHRHYGDVCGMVLLMSEFCAAFEADYVKHGPDAFGPVIRCEFEVGRSITGPQYVKAQQMRRLAQEGWAEAFRNVDVIVTAGMATDARWFHKDVKKLFPPRTEGVVLRFVSAMMPGFEVDPAATGQFFLMHDVTGLPALVMPTGINEHGFPVSIQIAGGAFDEVSVLRAAAALEADLALELRPPA